MTVQSIIMTGIKLEMFIRVVSRQNKAFELIWFRFYRGRFQFDDNVAFKDLLIN